MKYQVLIKVFKFSWKSLTWENVQWEKIIETPYIPWCHQWHHIIISLFVFKLCQISYHDIVTYVILCQKIQTLAWLLICFMNLILETNSLSFLCQIVGCFSIFLKVVKLRYMCPVMWPKVINIAPGNVNRTYKQISDMWNKWKLLN